MELFSLVRTTPRVCGGWTESRRRGRPSGTSPHGARRGVAWLTLVLGLRWQLRTKAVAALSGLATLALAGAVAIGAAAHGEDDSFPGILLISIGPQRFSEATSALDPIG
jgi:hypothetical protein